MRNRGCLAVDRVLQHLAYRFRVVRRVRLHIGQHLAEDNVAADRHAQHDFHVGAGPLQRRLDRVDIDERHEAVLLRGAGGLKRSIEP